MNYYETLYIVHPALEAGRLKDIIMGVEDSLKKMGGQPLAVELWGKRKLSHYIDKQKYGTYVLLQYNGEGKCTGDFAVELEHNPNILTYLISRIYSPKHIYNTTAGTVALSTFLSFFTLIIVVFLALKYFN